jgi:hypothetical protein
MAAVMVSPGRASAERRFFTGMALAILATIIVGFARSFFLRPLFPELPSPSEMIFYVHGVVFTAWIVLLVVQASLVAGGRTELHRKIGPFSAVPSGATRRATNAGCCSPPLTWSPPLSRAGRAYFPSGHSHSSVEY